MTTSPTLLQVRQLVKRYETGAGSVSVLNGVSLQVTRGDSLAIVGPSGSGKSTLLQIIGTLDQGSGGSVELDGHDLGNLNDTQLAQVRNTELGFVFQSHYLLPQCTAWENVLVPTLALARDQRRRTSTLRSGPATEDGSAAAAKEDMVEQRAQRLLKRVGLGDRMSHFPGQLSGGERQRVAVVRALINQPKLLLADEPTGALDRDSAESLGQLLVELNQEENVTLMVVTHSLELAKRMKRVLTLNGGTLVEQ